MPIHRLPITLLILLVSFVTATGASGWQTQPKLSVAQHHTIALKTSGMLLFTGGNAECSYPLDVLDIDNIIDVGSGICSVHVLKRDGTVTGGRGVQSSNVEGLAGIVQLAAAGGPVVGLKSDGTVAAVGEYWGGFGVPDLSGWTDIVQVAATETYTVGLKSDGSVVADGSNMNGQLDVNGWSDIVQIAAGRSATVGVRSDGKVVFAGQCWPGPCDVSGWTDIIQTATWGYHIVGLKSDGTVVATGWNHVGQCNVSGWTDIVQVGAGNAHTVGLRSDGTLVSTGSNSTGQLNVGSWNVFTDEVLIDRITYDETAGALTVIATSSGQPLESLASKGYLSRWLAWKGDYLEPVSYGDLWWKSWKGYYRNTFYGVYEKPVSVAVDSSGGGHDRKPVPFPQDTVAITGLSYDATSHTLTVSATSSDQPNVYLSAEGYGPLAWKSWLNIYRATFVGVTARPSSITVTSSGGGSATYHAATDTVTIASATYDAANQSLTVVASSSDQPNVTLTAEGYGAVVWKSWLGFYRTTFTGVAARPSNVVVNSSGGGMAVYTLPAADTVTIQDILYDSGKQTLTVVATSSLQPNAQLTAVGFGDLAWKHWLGFYRNTFSGVAQQPQSITVKSSGYGSDTRQVPYP